MDNIERKEPEKNKQTYESQYTDNAVSYTHLVLCIQVENMTAITASEQTMAAYLQNSFFSAGYLMSASIVALKCLNVVPDLAAWRIPEGDTAFSTRNFGEGVAQQAKMTARCV